MATPLSEDSRAVLGAAAAGGTSDEDELCHVQGARGYTHDIKSSNAGGSTKASLIDMVGEGDFPKLWLLRAALCGTDSFPVHEMEDTPWQLRAQWHQGGVTRYARGAC